MQPPLVRKNAQRIELFLSCRNLLDMDTFSKSDPFIKVSFRRDFSIKQFLAIGRTETIQNDLNPTFKKTFIVDYIFESRQDIKFEVYDDDGDGSSDFLGEVETTIGALMGVKHQTTVLELKLQGKSSGKIIVRCEKCIDSNKYYSMKIRGQKIANVDSFFDFWDKSDPYLKFLKIRDDNSFVEIQRTETIMDNLNPAWKQVDLQISRIINENNPRFRIECWDWEESGKDQFIGEVFVGPAELAQAPPITLKLANPSIKAPGTLIIDSCQVVTKPTFVDYLKGGLELNLTVAIDFTGSNGTPTSPNSLHYMNPTAPNQYQAALMTVGTILLNYDSDKLIQCFGFGGSTRFNGVTMPVSHCFPLNGNPANTNAAGLEQLMAMYAMALKNVSLSGPTYFNEVVRQIAAQAQSTAANPFCYHVLLILTDGEIHDMEQTINTISSACLLPFSIIIVGVGSADFENMSKLDGDNGLYDSNGRLVPRDIVQFVPFREVMLSQEMLAKELLAELPTQIVQYFGLRGIVPKEVIQA